MPIELHIQVVRGRCEDEGEPSIAYKFNVEDYNFRELSQFYMYLKYMCRHIEKLIDEDIQNIDEDDIEDDKK